MKRTYGLLSAGLIIILLLSACSSAAPSKTITDYLDCLKDGRYTESVQYLSDAEDNVFSEDMDDQVLQENMFPKMTYTVVSESSTGDSASVTVEITSVDMGTIMGDIMMELFSMIFSGMSEEELVSKTTEIMVEKVNADDAPMTTNTVSVDLAKADGKWKIVMTDSFANAITGGLLDFSEGLNEN